MPDPSQYTVDINAFKANPTTNSGSFPQYVPFSGTGLATTSDSKYLKGLTFGQDPEYIKAGNQGFWDSMGNAAVQAVGGVVLEFGEGAGYLLDLPGYVDLVKGNNEEFGNAFSNKMREWNEQLRQDGVPVYTTPDNEGFKPWDYKWWASNLPSIASAVSLALPSAGLVKGIGRIGKAMGGLNLAKKLGISTAALEAGEVLGMAATSRHMESMMEGMEVYETLYERAKNEGRGENEAVEIAAKGARDLYTKNIPLITTDIIQFALAFKGFRAASRVNKEAKASENLLRDLTINSLTESGEEGYQFISSKEAERTALINSKISKNDYTTFSSRMKDYLSEGDFWTSAFMGGLGGAVFEGAGHLASRKARKQQQLQSDLQDTVLEQVAAVVQNDPAKFEKVQDEVLSRLMISAIEQGRADKIESMLNTLQEGKFEGVDEQEQTYLKSKVEEAKKQLANLEKIYNDIQKDPTKAGDIELTRFELVNRAELQKNLKFAKRFSDAQLETVSKIGEERQWLPTYTSLLKSEVELSILENELSETAEKEVRENRIKVLKEQIERDRNTIRTTENISDKDIDNRLNINKISLYQESILKVLSDLAIDQTNKDYDKLQDLKEREKIKDQIKEHKKEVENKDVNAFINKIGPNSTFAELKEYKEAAKEMGKLDEFTQGYNKAVANMRAVAPPFESLTPNFDRRWEGNNLLREIEFDALSKIAERFGGLPSNQNGSQNPIQSLNSLYVSNPGFNKAVNAYYATQNSTSSGPKKENITKQPIKENVEDPTKDAGENIREKVADTSGKIWNAWNLQGLQFKIGDDGKPDPSKPTNSNLDKKINWEFLNTGQLPTDATLHFEYDFEDVYNKKIGVNPSNTAVFESVYYKDGNTNNKTSTNRFVVGVLTAYGEDRTYNSLQEGQELKQLREALYASVIASGNKSGTITLPYTAKVKNILGGRRWNTKQYKSIKEVLRVGQKPIFGVGRKIGDKKYIDTNGSPIENFIKQKNPGLGHTYLILQEPSGNYIPYKLYTKKVKEVQGFTELILDFVRQIPSTTTFEQRQSIINDIQEVTYVNDISYNNGTYYIVLKSLDENLETFPVTENELKAFIGNLLVQIDVNKINNEEYNNDIINQELVTTDLNPFVHFHSTKVQIDPISVKATPLVNVEASPTLPTPSTNASTVIPSEKKGKRTLPGNIDGPTTPITIGKGKPSIVETESQTYSPLDREQVINWFKKNLPQVDISFVDNLIEMYKKGGRKAWGVFQDNGIILYKGAPKGIEHHEAFHAVFNLFLTSEQTETILNEAQTLYPDTTREELEEKLADDFMRYVQQDAANAHNLGYNVRNFFKKLWEFIKSVFTSNVDVESLFYRINTGFYANSTPQSSSSIRFKAVNDPFITKRNIELINNGFFDALELYKRENGLEDREDLDVLREMNENTGDSVFSLYKSVFKGIREKAEELNDLEEYDKVDQLLEIMEQFMTVENGRIVGVGDLYQLALRDLNKFGIKIKGEQIETAQDEQREDQKEEINEEEDALEGWQWRATEDNAKDSLSYRVRKLLRRVYQYKYDKSKDVFEVEEDEYGFQKRIDFDEINNYLQRQLADSFDFDTMMANLEDLKKKKPEIHGIIQAINNDDNLASQFFSNFARAYVPEYNVQEFKEYDEQFVRTKFSVYNANVKNLSKILIDDWYTNLITPNGSAVTNQKGEIDTTKAKQFLAEYDKVVSSIKSTRTFTPKLALALSKVIEKFGIIIEPETLEKENTDGYIAVGNTLVNRKGIDNLLYFIDSPKNSLRTLINTIANGTNPYKGENTEQSSADKVAKTLARNVKNLHQDTFINGDGKQVYSYLLPTFTHKRIQDFKSSTVRAELLNNWWYSKNKWLQELNRDNNQDILDNFNVVLINALFRKNKNKGITYFDMTDQELDISDINMFDFNGRKSIAFYRVPILSDSPQAPYISFKKYSQVDVIDAMYQLALAEKERIDIASDEKGVKIKNWNDERGNGKKYQFVTVFNDTEVDIADEVKAKEAIKNWLDNELEIEKSRLIENGVLTQAGNFNKDTVSDRAITTKDFLKDYFYNKVLANAMITQLFSVDLAFYKNHDDFQKRNGQIFKFTKMINTLANWKGISPGEHYKVVYLNDVKINSELKESVRQDLLNKGYEEEYANRIANLYDDINQTDAQTYITVDRYREIQIGLGLWNDNKQEIFEKVKKGKSISSEEQRISFNPIKPFYFGTDIIAGDVTNKDIKIPVQHKNSEVVLLPQFVKENPKLEKVLNYLNKKGVSSAMFTSSVKAGEFGAVDVDNIDDAVIHVMENRFFGIQQETPEHHKDTENLLGSQIKKLILSDIPDDAKIAGYTKKELFNIFQKLLTDNIKESYNSLKEELSTFDKVQEILMNEVIKRNLGEYFEQAIEKKVVNGVEQFNRPLFDPIHAKKFEAILNALVRNNVTKQKINGGSFVLMSNFGVNKNLKIVRNDKGGIEYMEVMLPSWTKIMFPRLPNGEVDIKAIKKADPSILDLFGYRYPTEHKYSMKKLRVVGFTPDVMGGVAILPAEITRVSGEDFDIDKMYVMIPNIEYKDGKLQKVKYDLGNIDKLSKEQRDNAIIDLMGTIWSSPEVSDQITIPGGFEDLKRLAADKRALMSVNASIIESENPILLRTQMEYFIRNSNAYKIIGISANHNSNHAITQYSKLKLAKKVSFNGISKDSLHDLKDIEGILISRNLSQFLAAFVDNAKDPVAGDLNLNTFTFDTVALIVRLGFPLDIAIDFITQPAIVEYSQQYFREGGTRKAEYTAFKEIIKKISKGKKLNLPFGSYNINLKEITPPTSLNNLTQEQAEQQLKILYTFKDIKEQANSLSKLVRATRNDNLGTRKNISGNIKALRDINTALIDENLKGQEDILNGDVYPLVKVSNEYGISLPQQEILNRFFPYGKVAYQKAYEILEKNKGSSLTEDEITFINNQSLVYYLSGFDFFNQKDKSKWVNIYPSHFAKLKNEESLKKYEILQYLKYVPKDENNVVDKIEFVSGATISNEQRTNLVRSWEAMLNSDNPVAAKLARDLVQYSYHTNGLSFSYKGFSHLIPTSYFESMTDLLDRNYREYMYQLQEDAELEELFNPFIDQLVRQDNVPYGLIPSLQKKDIINSKTKGSLTTSILVNEEFLNINNKEEVNTKYIKYYNDRAERIYKFSGLTALGNYVYNIIEDLGNGNIYEYSIGEEVSTIIEANKLPKFSEKDFYPTSENISEEFNQINSTRELEIKYGFVDAFGKYKSYGYDQKGEISTKSYNRLRVDVGNVNRLLESTGYKAVVGRKTDSNGKVYFIAQIVERSYQIESVYGSEPNEVLNDLIRRRLSELGIKVEYFDDLYTRIGKSATAVADITRKLIKISKGLERIDTLPEETGHFIEAYSRGSAVHARLMEIVPNLPEYAEVVEEYNEVYEGNTLKLKQEAIGKLIGKALISKTVKIENKTLLGFLQKLWNDFIKLFRNVDEAKLREEIEDITGKLAENFLSGNLVEKESVKVDGELYQLGTEELEESEKILRKGIDSILKKIKIYEKRAFTSFTEKEKDILNQLTSDLDKKLYEQGLTNYVKNAKRELKNVATRYSEINRKPGTLEERKETLKTLQQINNYINGFKETLNEIVKSPYKIKGAAKTAVLIEKLEKEYYNVGKPILAEILKEFNTNEALNVSGALDTLEKDISWPQRFLDQLAEADDSILNILDVIAKDAKQRGRLKTLDFTKDLIALKKKLEKGGIASDQFMYERDFSGKITGNILQEYNYGEWAKQRKAFYNANPKPKREEFASEKEYKHALDVFHSKQNKWYNENSQENPNAEKIIANKLEEFKKKYNNEKLAFQKHQEWINQNISQGEYFDYQAGESTIYQKYIRELSLPAEKYKNQVYQDVQNNTLQKEYYDFVMKHRELNDASVMDQYKLKDLVPQIRKDFFERLSTVDNEGKKSLKSLKNVLGETKTALSELVFRHENDLEYGLTDESNQPINFLPVHFTRKIQDPSNLSLDFTSALIAHTYSVNDFSEMSKVIDTLEFAKDVVAQREVKTGKFDPVTFFKTKGEKGKAITKKGEESLAYQRLVDWMNMTVYGNQSKNEGKIGAFDKGKLADLLNNVTSLSSLALNLYSGISNITVGNINTRMEGIAGEFFTNADLLEGDKVYTTSLPGVLANIGQRAPTDKLSLWLERMDTMQNYDREFRNLDVARNTVTARLMKTSSLYFINHAGEHLIQSRLSLALANNTKVKDLMGKEMSLYDAFDVVGNKLVMKTNLQKVANKKGVGLFKKEEDGQPLTERDIIRFINRQNFLNKRLHGIYNNVDKNAAQQYALGRLALMFRKFIKPGWNRRFATLTYNQEGEAYTEGYYTSTFNFFKNLRRDLKQANYSIAKVWDNLSPREKANFHRTTTEAAYVIASTIAIGVLTNLAGDGDDDDNYLLNLAAYEAYRTYSELRFFSSIKEGWRIVQSPAASMYTVTKALKLLDVWDWGKDIEKGHWKGYTRFERDLIKMFPLIGTGVNVIHPEEHLKFYSTSGIGLF